MSCQFINCAVCGVLKSPRRVGGVQVCEACKRFFLRNRGRSQQINHTSKFTTLCYEVSETTTTSNNSNKEAIKSAGLTCSGSIWRNLCPACRLAKCESLGMSTGYISNNNNNNNNNVMMTMMINQDLQIVEKTLQNIVEGARQLAIARSQLYLRNQDFNVTNEFEAWQVGAVHFRNMSNNLRDCYLRYLPGYQDLTVREQCLLFTNCVLPINIAETANHNEPLSLGMKTTNYAKALQYFPEMTYVYFEQKYIKGMLDEWRPNDTEFSFLLAFLVYNSNVGTTDVDLDKASRRIETAYTAYNQSHFSGADNLVRREQMSRGVATFCSAGKRRFESFVAMMRRCPQLGSIDFKLLTNNNNTHHHQTTGVN